MKVERSDGPDRLQRGRVETRASAGFGSDRVLFFYPFGCRRQDLVL